jgi:hypothetical protein
MKEGQCYRGADCHYRHSSQEKPRVATSTGWVHHSYAESSDSETDDEDGIYEIP